MGSEMCIRDRAREVHGRVEARDVLPVDILVAAGAGGELWLLLAPVSYTHLTLPTIYSV